MDAQFDQKVLFDMLRDIDQAEMSGGLILHTSGTNFQVYFQNGLVVYACEMSGWSEWVELSKQQTLHLARATRGTFKFDGSLEASVIMDWKLRAADLILEAARTVDEERLRAEYGDPSLRMLSSVFDVETRIKGLMLSPTEFAVLAALETPLTIDKLKDQLGLSMLEVLRAVHALCSAGVMDPPFEVSEEEEEFLDQEEMVPESEYVPQFSANLESQAVGQYHTSSAQYSAPVAAPAQYGVPMAAPPMVAKVAQPIVAKPSEPVASPYAAQHANSAAASASTPVAHKPAARNKLNTGALQKLAGIKIRSMSGSDGEEQESERFYQQGRSAARSGNLPAAETLLRKALDLSPTNPTYLTEMGRILLKSTKRQKEGEGMLLAACAEDHEMVEPRLLLAGLYESLGMKAKEETLLKGILAIEPTHAKAKKRLEELNKGNFLGGIFDRWKK